MLPNGDVNDDKSLGGGGMKRVRAFFEGPGAGDGGASIVGGGGVVGDGGGTVVDGDGGGTVVDGDGGGAVVDEEDGMRTLAGADFVLGLCLGGATRMSPSDGGTIPALTNIFGLVDLWHVGHASSSLSSMTCTCVENALTLSALNG